MRFVSIAAITIAAALAGCTSMPSMNSGGVPPGMNDKGEVIDSTKVEPGSGTKVTGIDGFEGEIVGKPAKNSKFNQLKIGMTNDQVLRLIGDPTTEAGQLTAKAYIPFFKVADRTRIMYVYKGHGRLVFSGGAYQNYKVGKLLYIIHNPNESGTL